MRRYYFGIAAAIILLDQWSKWLVVRNLTGETQITVIPGLFNIVYTRNPGIAFGVMSDTSSAWRTAALVVFSLAVIAIVTVALWKELRPPLHAQGVALALILGGAAGNLIDRALTGSVVDFLDFYHGTYHWHTFNTADSAIVAGAILWALTLWKH